MNPLPLLQLGGASFFRSAGPIFPEGIGTGIRDFEGEEGWRVFDGSEDGEDFAVAGRGEDKRAAGEDAGVGEFTEGGEFFGEGEADALFGVAGEAQEERARSMKVEGVFAEMGDECGADNGVGIAG
jgi:hypothetical protein